MKEKALHSKALYDLAQWFGKRPTQKRAAAKQFGKN
jgi:hypothetical protein